MRLTQEESIFTKHLADLKKASKFCQQQLRILKKLQRLRDVRKNQLQSRLNPNETDDNFETNKAAIVAKIESTQLAINKLTVRIDDAQRRIGESALKSVDNEEDSGIIPAGLPPPIKNALFGSFDHGRHMIYLKQSFRHYNVQIFWLFS